MTALCHSGWKTFSHTGAPDLQNFQIILSLNLVFFLRARVSAFLSFSRHHLHSVAAQPGLHHGMERQVQSHSLLPFGPPGSVGLL